MNPVRGTRDMRHAWGEAAHGHSGGRDGNPPARKGGACSDGNRRSSAKDQTKAATAKPRLRWFQQADATELAPHGSLLVRPVRRLRFARLPCNSSEQSGKGRRALGVLTNLLMRHL